MMLKILDTTSNVKGAPNKDGWILWDKITEMSWKKGSTFQLVKDAKDVQCNKWILGDKEDFYAGESVGIKCKKDGEEIYFVVNTTCYVLSDEGKTVEKLL